MKNSDTNNSFDGEGGDWDIEPQNMAERYKNCRLSKIEQLQAWNMDYSEMMVGKLLERFKEFYDNGETPLNAEQTREFASEDFSICIDKKPDTSVDAFIIYLSLQRLRLGKEPMERGVVANLYDRASEACSVAKTKNWHLQNTWVEDFFKQLCKRGISGEREMLLKLGGELIDNAFRQESPEKDAFDWGLGIVNPMSALVNFKEEGLQQKPLENFLGALEEHSWGDTRRLQRLHAVMLETVRENPRSLISLRLAKAGLVLEKRWAALSEQWNATPEGSETPVAEVAASPEDLETIKGVSQSLGAPPRSDFAEVLKALPITEELRGELVAAAEQTFLGQPYLPARKAQKAPRKPKTGTPHGKDPSAEQGMAH